MKCVQRDSAGQCNGKLVVGADGFPACPKCGFEYGFDQLHLLMLSCAWCGGGCLDFSAGERLFRCWNCGVRCDIDGKLVAPEVSPDAGVVRRPAGPVGRPVEVPAAQVGGAGGGFFGALCGFLGMFFGALDGGGRGGVNGGGFVGPIKMCRTCTLDIPLNAQVCPFCRTESP